jgi:hypothetical protein
MKKLVISSRLLIENIKYKYLITLMGISLNRDKNVTSIKIIVFNMEINIKIIKIKLNKKKFIKIIEFIIKFFKKSLIIKKKI